MQWITGRRLHYHQEGPVPYLHCGLSHHLDGEISPLPSIELVHSEGNEREVLVCMVGLISSLIPLTDLKFVLMAGSSMKNAKITDRAESSVSDSCQSSCLTIMQTGIEDWHDTVASAARKPDVVNCTSLICSESTGIGKTGSADNSATEDDTKICSISSVDSIILDCDKTDMMMIIGFF